ncbi:hypothetical protein [Sinomonas atrocyanea]
MDLNYAWLLVPGALALVGAAALVLWRKKGTDDAVLVAHGDRLASLPSYQRLVRRQRTWLAVVVGAALVLAGALLVAAARPILASSQRPEQRSRDIILCLDTSGSMSRADSAIVDVFASMVRDFHGERIGMTIFDGSGVQVFPSPTTTPTSRSSWAGRSLPSTSAAATRPSSRGRPRGAARP